MSSIKFLKIHNFWSSRRCEMTLFLHSFLHSGGALMTLSLQPLPNPWLLKGKDLPDRRVWKDKLACRDHSSSFFFLVDQTPPPEPMFYSSPTGLRERLPPVFNSRDQTKKQIFLKIKAYFPISDLTVIKGVFSSPLCLVPCFISPLL